jgi:tetratricopeptide (TPR) repeat protein
MKTLQLCIVLLAGFFVAVAVGAEDTPKGKVVERLVAKHDAGQTYAVYLPKKYDPARKWPILYGFSPAGRGTDPVRFFERAAERFGWIVVGSNNAKNGPSEPIVEAVKALWQDTHARYSIDDAHVYTTGFSGGARVAFNLSEFVKNPVAAVLPCGAGLGRLGQPAQGSKMIVCGMVGKTCFNYPEMLRLFDVLERMKITYRLFTFEGGHHWPPEALAMQAARFVQLHALRAQGAEAAKEAVKLLAEETAEIENLLKDEKTIYAAYRRLQELAALFADTPEGEKLNAQLKELAEKAQVKREGSAEEARQKIVADYEKAPEKERTRKLLESAKPFMENPDNKDTFAQLRLGALAQFEFLRCAQTAAQLMQNKRFAEALEYYTRALAVNPRDGATLYGLAGACAQAGKKQEALACLERLRQAGFNNAQMVLKDANFASLRDDEEFKNIVTQMEKAAPQKTE